MTTVWSIIQQLWPIIALGFPFAVTLAVNLAKRLDTKLPAAQRATLEKFVADAVTAVEQMFKNAIPATPQGQAVLNAQKKTMATTIATSLAGNAKVTVPPQDILSALIEKAVGVMPKLAPSGGTGSAAAGAITQPVAAVAGSGPVAPGYAAGTVPFRAAMGDGDGIPIPGVALTASSDAPDAPTAIPAA